MRVRLILAVLLAVAPLSASAAKPMRILFIGNSLTYTNDLPGMVVRLGKLDGRRIEAVTLASPNYSLGDHLATSNVHKLARERWDLVVMQQGPSSLAESRSDLIRDATRIAKLFPERRLAMLMVWPARQHAGSWDRVIESYTLAAQAVNGMLIPAGTAVRSAAHLPVLDAAGFHPSPAGTYLAALVAYRTIIGHLPPSVGRAETARKIAGSSLALSEEELGSLIAVVESVTVARTTVSAAGTAAVRSAR